MIFKTMNGVLTFENITFLIALGGVAFGIYHFFRAPDIESKEELIRLNAVFDAYKEIADKSEKTAVNHLNSIDIKLDNILGENKNMSIQIAKLETTVNERLPKKV